MQSLANPTIQLKINSKEDFFQSSLPALLTHLTASGVLGLIEEEQGKDTGIRAGRRTPGGLSPERSRGAESPPSTCWPPCF